MLVGWRLPGRYYSYPTVKPSLISVALLIVLAGTSCQHDSATAQPGGGGYTTLSTASLSAVDNVDENSREAARLAYTEDLLRRKSTRQLPSHQRRRRYQALKLLHAYRTAAEVSAAANTATTLLDSQGHPVALRYLLQHTGGEQALQQLQPGALSTTDNRALRHWARMSGLSLEECALINGAE